MEGLPDELLLRIFSLIRDGPTLLDAVPLVCKRWHAVSRDPEAWAGVRLAVSAADRRSPATMLQVGRLLLRAPFLAHLNTDMFDDPSVQAAVRRGALVVRHFRRTLNMTCAVSAAEQQALLELLYRSRHQLREAEMELSSWSRPLVDAAGRTTLDVLAVLARLEALRVSVDHDYPYASELAGALPRLRLLHVRESRVYTKDRMPLPLLRDLVLGAAATLCEFRLMPLCVVARRQGGPAPAKEDLLAAMVDALLQCERLRCLHAGVRSEAFEVDDAEVVECVCGVVERCAALPASLATLYVGVLWTWRPDHNVEVSYQSLLRKCAPQLDRFKRQRPGVDLRVYDYERSLG